MKFCGIEYLDACDGFKFFLQNIVKRQAEAEYINFMGTGGAFHTLAVLETLPFAGHSVWLHFPDSGWDIETSAFILIADHVRGFLIFVIAVELRAMNILPC